MNDSFHEESGRIRQSLGNLLKEARKSKKKSLEEIAAATGIGISKLQALESGDRRGLPADVFVRGFIRMYAAQVDADQQVALELYEREWGGQAHSSGDETAILQGEEFAKNSLILRHWPTLLTTIILCAIIYLITKFFFPALFISPNQPIKETLSDELPKIEIVAPDSDSDLSTVIAQGVEILEQEVTDDTEDSVAPQSEEETAEDQHNEPVPSSSEDTDNSTAPAGQQPSQAETTPLTESSAARAATETPSSPEATTEAPTHYTLHLKFTERTWVKVSIDGQDPQEEIFKQNSEKTWEADKSIDLYLGNAGGVKIDLNGKPMPLEQESGQTVRITIP